MSRRRKKNPLLTRIIVISLAAHVIAVPILAHYGAFDKMKKSFGTATVVMLDQQKKVVQPPPPVKKKAVPQAQTANRNQNKGQSPARTDLTKVAVDDSGGGNGPDVPQGTRTGGTPPPGTNLNPNKGPDTNDTKATTPPPVKPLDKPPAPPPTPPVKPVEPTVTKPKHVPVYTEVEPVYQPEPAIPDDLRSEPLDKTAVIEVTIEADGSIATAALAQGTGLKELDDIAMKTAKTWRFKPATADGEAVSGKLRLRIEFKVE